MLADISNSSRVITKLVWLQVLVLSTAAINYEDDVTLSSEFNRIHSFNCEMI